jgi:predicted PurR-regulated permease PerM
MAVRLEKWWVHVGASFCFRKGIPREMGGTARRAATATLVALSIVIAALALWKLRIVIALLFLGFVIASAMRPSVEWLYRRARVPRSVGIVLHYLGFLAAITLFLYLVVPVAITQIDHAIGQVPTSRSQLHHAAVHSHGIRHEILHAIDKRLRQLPSGTSLLHPAITVTRTLFEILVGILFMFAVGAYWIFERDAAIALVQSMVPRRHRRVTRDTWVLIDMKLGAFVRGEFLLVVVVATLLSLAFWLDGEPYWLLIGTFAGIVELVPIIGPLAAGAIAIGVGLTAGWMVAVGAGIAVLVLRQLEDYVIAPRIMGHAVGLSPLVVLVSVVGFTYLLGGVYILIAIPIASIVATVVDVVVRGRDPAQEDAPAVLFAGTGEGKR